MEEMNVNGINVVHNLSLDSDTFRGSSIRHFNIQYKSKGPVWLKENKIIPYYYWLLYNYLSKIFT